MDLSRQGLTRNESLRSETPTSFFIKKPPQIYLQRLFNSFWKASKILPWGRQESGRPPLSLGTFSAGFLRVPHRAPLQGKREFGLGFSAVTF